MRRLEIQDLLPPSAITHQSRRELLQRTALASTGPTDFVVGGESNSGTLAVDSLSGLPRTSANDVTAQISAMVGGDNGGASAADSLGDMLQGPVKDVTSQISSLTAQITNLNATQQTQIGATQDNTQAVSQNTATKGSGGSSIASTAGSLASNLLGGGLSPIISGLMSLFGGGGGKTTPSPLIRFELPAPVQYQAGLSSGPGGTPVQPVEYGQGGQARTMQASPAPQVNIQVNAMDSRSFLDHSEEIAQAVKAAMLNSNSLNDVIADL